jgi:hypothetical protein
MAKNRISLGMDIAGAARAFKQGGDDVDDAASRAVRQLAVLAEGAMKEEVPEGAGRDQSTRDSIDTRFRRQGKTANVGARKRTDDGGLLAEIIVEGTDGSSYDPSPGLVGFLGKRMEDWAAAKLGSPSLAYPVAWSIVRDGHERLPNRFVDRSLNQWEGQVEDVAGDEVRRAMSELMRGAD